MKKLIFAMALCLAVSLAASACTGPAGDSASTPETSQTAVSEAASPKVETIDFSAVVPARNEQAVLQNAGSPSLISPYRNDAEKFAKEGSVVVGGMVESSHYVLDGSTVHTKSEVRILESYQGNLQEGEVIGVRELGGFIPSDVLTTAIMEQKYGSAPAYEGGVEILDIRYENFKVMEEGEEVILFLVPITRQVQEEFEGCYDLIRVWQGKLLFMEESNEFVPYMPEEELMILEKEAQAAQPVAADNAVGSEEEYPPLRSYTREEFAAFAEEVTGHPSN